MSDDLARQLRAQPDNLCLNAAAELDRLRAENARLRQALEGLLEWRDQPEIKEAIMAAYMHGFSFYGRRGAELGGYWERARAVLDTT